MAARRSQQRRRDEARASREREEALVYRPPDRGGLEESVFTYDLGVDDLIITVRQWTRDDVVVDFAAQAYVSLPGGVEPVLLASVDCLNHGTIHLHDEVDDPGHDGHVDIVSIRSEEDVSSYYGRGLDELAVFAHGRLQAWRRKKWNS